MEHQKIAWADYLRVIACFLVVLSHSCDPFVSQFDANRADFLSGAFWGSAVRACVPLFVMISGFLLLPVEQPLGVFYRKRLSRILVPLAVWSIITPFVYYAYIHSGIDLAGSLSADDHTLNATISKTWSWIFNFNFDTTPLWYLYMLVGLYLFMPIISAWLKQAAKREIEIFLGIWLLTMCLPYLSMAAPLLGYTGNYGNMGLFGVCDWNGYGTFYYFSGFLGYLVLAYYLKVHPLKWSGKKTVAVALPLFLVGYAITSVGFIITQKYFPGNYPALEIVWFFSGINVFMMTFAAYILIAKFAVRNSAFVSRLAGLTFGVYLCHFFIVRVFYDLLYESLPVVAAVKIPVIAICSFCVSLGVVWMLSKLPFKKYIIG